MNQRFAIGFGVGLVVLALGTWWAVVDSRGNHLDPKGKIGKVRTLQVDDNATIVVIDFKVTNDADVPMTIRTIDTSMTVPENGPGDGNMLAASDLAKVFRSYPDIGDQYNPPLRPRDEIKGHTVVDRMVGMSFNLPKAKVDARTDLVLRLEESSGPVLELHEK